jgi:hypothetical protein
LIAYATKVNSFHNLDDLAAYHITAFLPDRYLCPDSGLVEVVQLKGEHHNVPYIENLSPCIIKTDPLHGEVFNGHRTGFTRGNVGIFSDHLDYFMIMLASLRRRFKLLAAYTPDNELAVGGTLSW